MSRIKLRIVGIILVAGLVAFQYFEVTIKKHELASVQHELIGRENEVRMLTAQAERILKERRAVFQDSVAKTTELEKK